MKLWVGLGNPGNRYAANRHNVGFMVLDRIASDHGFGPWRARHGGQVAEGRIGPVRIVLIKPLSYMNNSGQPVGEAMRYLKLGAADITVFHDELDLAPGKVRHKTGGGHAGHNGLRSIHAHVGPDHHRVRIGIGHPGDKRQVSAWVLSDFPKAEQALLDDMLRGISEGAAALAADDPARFLNAVALRVAPPRQTGPDQRKTRTPDATSPAAQPPQNAPPEQDSRSALQRLVDRFR